MARENRSKYNFGKLEVGDTLDVPPIDLLSMKNSLRAFNIKHRRKERPPLPDIKMKYTEVSDSLVQAERIE